MCHHYWRSRRQGLRQIRRATLTIALGLLAACPPGVADDNPFGNAPQPAKAEKRNEKDGDANARAAKEQPRVAPVQAPAPRLAPPQPAPMIVPPARIIIQGGFRGRRANRVLLPGEGDTNYALFPNNRELVRQLERAQEFIVDERLADAFQLLDDILGEQQDFFYQPDRQEQLHRSLKAEARRLIGQLPADALEQYDVQFGATARHLLEKAAADADASALAAVVRRYFNTQAGFEAAWLLGRQHLDHGQTLAAALTYQMLYDSPRARKRFDPALSLVLSTCWMRAGQSTRAESVLRELRQQGVHPRLAAKNVPLFSDDAHAIEWLAANIGMPAATADAQVSDWRLHRGNASRNAPGSGGSPLLSTPRWQQSLTSEPQTDTAAEAMNRQLVDTTQIDLPSETPLAIGDTVVVRTPRWILGVNLRTGKRVWEYETWENENYTSRQQVLNPMTGTMINVVPQKLTTRITIASDGRAAFIVEDRGNQPFTFPGMVVPMPRTQTAGALGANNKLLARELATQGKLLWEVGGEGGEDEPQLAGVYFHGAPLVVGGELYIIGELKGEITLFVLNAGTGKLDWSQPLATVETPIALDSFRRFHGAMPSLADGVIVCPTSAGAIVAVDLANRSLLWGYQYPRNQLVNPLVARRMSREMLNPFDGARWTDGAVIIASGRALVAPVDSDQLHCVNLIDGKLAWKPQERKDNLYIGGVWRDTAILVGRQQVQGVNLATGEAAWPPQPFAGDAHGVPSGRGYLSAGHYYLPLSTAEVVKIDMADGHIKSRAKSRKGYVPGNLVCYQGNILSLTDDSLDCFFQLDEHEQWASRALRDRPNDPDALAISGEILVDQGKPAEGLVQLERAFELAPNERTRELLIEAHLELLRIGFAAHRARAGDIEKLITDPGQKTVFARLMATGLQEMGETMAAFEYYVRMCQAPQQSHELETVVANQHSVRRDRWVRAKIAELRQAASTDERRAMDARIADHLESLGGPANLAAFRQYLAYFGGNDDGLRTRFIERLIEENQHLEAEWWLLRQARSENRQLAAEAYYRLAELMQKLNRPDDAANCLRRLAQDFADQTLANDKTAQEAVDAAAADGALGGFLAPGDFWPKNIVSKEVLPRSLNYSAVPLEVDFGREPFAAQLALELDASRQELMVRDGFGRELFRAPLYDTRPRAVNYSSLPWARANGHILLVQSSTQVLAVDALSSQRDGKSRVLWRHDLGDLLAHRGSLTVRPSPGLNRRRLSQLVDQTGMQIGGIWPVGYELVCLQRGNKLLGVDVFSGEVLWSRQDIRPADEIFGDDEYLFVVPVGSSEAIVLRTLDGANVGTRPIPTSHRYLACGRKIVTFSTAGGKSTARVYDPWTREDVWQQSFAAGAKIESLDTSDIVVLDPAGKLVIYSLEEMRPIIEADVEIPRTLADVQLFRTADRYVVLAAGQLIYRQGMPHMYPVQNVFSRAAPIVEGHAYGFARPHRATGGDSPAPGPAKPLWTNKNFGPTASLVNQPANLPILVFAMNTNEQTSGGRASTSVLCLDTRDGRIFGPEKIDNGSSTVALVADPETKNLEVRCASATLRLSFGEKP